MTRSLAVDLLIATAASIAAVLVALVLVIAPAAAATPEDDLGGRIEAEVDGRIMHLPSLTTDITANVTGDLVAVEVVQTFLNPTGVPLNATYLFPLDKDAAVHAMEMRVGDEMVIAEIQKRAAARQTFEQAKASGQAAALLEQHRPNMFTQSVANLMPGLPITVTIRYVQTVPRIDGTYELVVPLVVGPRYIPSSPRPLVARLDEPDRRDGEPPADVAPSQPAPDAPSGQWSFGPVPRYPGVAGLTIPKSIDADRVSIRVNLTASQPIASIASPTHAVTIGAAGDTRTVTLAAGRTIDNRDFVLGYRLAGETIGAGLLAHRDDRGGYLSLLIEPPAIVDATDVTPREIVFVLDTSGSMGGKPLDASKAFMRHALGALRASDYFRIIRFSSSASELASAPIAATPTNVARGLGFVEGLDADGGTEVLSGLEKAFAMHQAAGTHRLIVFLSDGYVGNEDEILRMISANIGQARTYALGVGSSVNRYLLAEMAHQGRGFVRFIDPTENTEEAAIAFANRLATTVMTDLEIDWGGLDVDSVVPSGLPDLFAGDSLRVSARYAKGGTATVRIKGRINGREATLPVSVTLPAAPTGTTTRAIALSWARAEIKDQMRRIMTPGHLRRDDTTDASIEARVTRLGLDYALATQWTSFVAVSKQVVNDAPATTRDADVPVPMVDGVGAGAYGGATTPAPRLGPPVRPLPRLERALAPAPIRLAAKAATGNGFGGVFAGGSTPEPEHLLALLAMLATLAGAALSRRRRLSRSTG